MIERVKRSILNALLAVLLISGVSLPAQDNSPDGPPPGPPPDHNPQTIVENLTKQLGLNKKQQEEVLDIFQEQFDEMESMRDEGVRPEPSEMEAMQDKLHDEVNKVLTKEQKEKYLEIIKEEQARFKERPPRHEN